jgi:hypothetical protein
LANSSRGWLQHKIEKTKTKNPELRRQIDLRPRKKEKKRTKKTLKETVLYARMVYL